MEPVVENAQQLPHCFWFLTGVTTPLVVQSMLLGGAPPGKFAAVTKGPLDVWGMSPRWVETNSWWVRSLISFTAIVQVEFPALWVTISERDQNMHMSFQVKTEINEQSGDSLQLSPSRLDLKML